MNAQRNHDPYARIRKWNDGRFGGARAHRAGAGWVRGEAVDTATTYGFDSVTMMQESKTTLCQVAKKAVRRTFHGEVKFVASPQAIAATPAAAQATAAKSAVLAPAKK